MKTSNERRGVAERLRARHRERTLPGMLEPQDLDMQRRNCLQDIIDCLPDGESVFTVLADLIDPTCEIVEDEPYSCHCSACGQGRMYPQMYWRYCPHCGARVVNIDDAD